MLLLDLFRALGFILVLCSLPLLVELFVLTAAASLPRFRGKKREKTLKSLNLTVLVPAHNEETLVGRCVRSVLASCGPGTDILVVAHNCTDQTAVRAQEAGARVLVLDNRELRGKGSALRYGLANAALNCADAVLVLDADSVVSSTLIEVVRERFLSGAQALQCRYEVHNVNDGPRTKMMALALHAFNVIRPRGRDALGLSSGILGNGFALSRDVLARIPYKADSVVEDLEYHLLLVHDGIRVRFIDEAIVYGEMPVTAAAATTQRARWEGGRKRMAKQWTPRLLASVLRGRVSLFEPLLDLLSVPIATEVMLLLLAACLPLLWMRLYALAGFADLALHVLAAARSGLGIRASLHILANVPRYILWKICITPEV